VSQQHDGSGARIRVLVVDDHRVFGEALAARLGAEADLEVVGTATSRADAEPLARRQHPDVVVLDVELGDGDGLDLVPRLLEDDPECRIVVATAHDTTAVAGRALQVGARGFFSKDGRLEELLAVIRGVVRDETWIPPRLLTAVLRDIREQNQRDREFESLMRQLTPREREVLAGMVSGLDRAGIARELGLAVDTVRTHTQNMFAKLQVHSVLEAVGLAVRAGADSGPTPRRSAHLEGAAARRTG
jgi:DNA-binding NarL/FixJ family response regulator